MLDNDILPKPLSEYITRWSSPEPEYLKRVRERTEQEMPQAHMISGVLQGRLLSILSSIIRPKNILEIGTFTGYATLCLAEGLPTGGTITTLERNEHVRAFYETVFSQSENKEKIKAYCTDALHFLQNYKGPQWDLVFLDANKRKYIEYTELLLPQMPSGGIILADNVLWKNKVLTEIDDKDKMTKSLHEFNIFIKEDERVEAVILPIRDGLTMIRKI